MMADIANTSAQAPTAVQAPNTPAQARSSEVRSTLFAIGVSAVAGIVTCFIVATLAEAAGVSNKFQPLSSYYVLVIIGVVAGAFGWNIARRRAADARRTLGRLVPAVIAVSFIPDVLVGVTKALPDTTWGGIAALMVMHLTVAAGAVASYWHFLPVEHELS